jgi:hypothetical protein
MYIIVAKIFKSAYSCCLPTPTCLEIKDLVIVVVAYSRCLNYILNDMSNFIFNKKYEFKRGWCQGQKRHLFSNFNIRVANKEKFNQMTNKEVDFLWSINNKKFFYDQ